MPKLLSNPMPNIPWQDKPAGCDTPVWRYDKNPIIRRNAIPSSNSVFNSAVVSYKGGFAGVFRCDSKAMRMDLFVGFSDDGYNWKINHDPIEFQGDAEITRKEYRYDPRVCFVEDRYYVTWCNGCHGPTIGMAYTYDFNTFVQIENAFLPFNRNGVLFPKKINGMYCMLSRPSDNGHTRFGDIYLSQSPDLTFWGKHRFVMGVCGGWQSTKIGPGPVPVETDEGWLLIYHGVRTSCSGFIYRVGSAILDADRPWIVKYRSSFYIMAPEEVYELTGDVPNVVFPCAVLTDSDTGRMAVYYGGADTVVGLAFTTVDEIVNFTKEHNMV